MNWRYFYMVAREIAGWCAAAVVVLLALRAFMSMAHEAYTRRQFVKTLRATQNSAEDCRICGKWDPPPVGLLCINSGDTYSLDLFDGGNQRDDGIYGYVHFSNGGDRLTGLRFEIKKVPDEKWGMVTLWAGNGYLDAGEMKTLYCDSCIEKLLEATEGSEVSGLVVVRGQDIYPVREGSLWAGPYQIVARAGRENWTMEISCGPSCKSYGPAGCPDEEMRKSGWTPMAVHPEYSRHYNSPSNASHLLP